MNPLSGECLERALTYYQDRDFLKAAQVIAKEGGCSIPYAMHELEGIVSRYESTQFSEVHTSGLPLPEQS